MPNINLPAVNAFDGEGNNSRGLHLLDYLVDQYTAAGNTPSTDVQAFVSWARAYLAANPAAGYDTSVQGGAIVFRDGTEVHLGAAPGSTSETANSYFLPVFGSP